MLQSRQQLLPHPRQRTEVDWSAASCVACPWLLSSAAGWILGLAHCSLQAAKDLLEHSAALPLAPDCGQCCSCMHPALQAAIVSEKTSATPALCKQARVCECKAC